MAYVERFKVRVLLCWGVNPGLVHEQRVVEIQKNLEKVLDKAKSYDLSKDEIRDLFEILMEE